MILNSSLLFDSDVFISFFFFGLPRETHKFVSTSFNPFSFFMHASTTTRTYFHHNRTPTSGGNILIFMLPKHEKKMKTVERELRLLWYTKAWSKKKPAATKGKKKFSDIKRKKIPSGIYLLKKHSLDGLPSKKNNYLIVYFFPSTSPSHTRGLKVVNSPVGGRSREWNSRRRKKVLFW